MPGPGTLATHDPIRITIGEIIYIGVGILSGGWGWRRCFGGGTGWGWCFGGRWCGRPGWGQTQVGQVHVLQEVKGKDDLIQEHTLEIGGIGSTITGENEGEYTVELHRHNWSSHTSPGTSPHCHRLLRQSQHNLCHL